MDGGEEDLVILFFFKNIIIPKLFKIEPRQKLADVGARICAIIFAAHLID